MSQVITEINDTSGFNGKDFYNELTITLHCCVDHVSVTYNIN